MPRSPANKYPMFSAEKFSRDLRVRIAERGIEAKQAAAEMNLSASTICRISAGKKPDVESYLRIMDWLKR